MRPGLSANASVDANANATAGTRLPAIAQRLRAPADCASTCANATAGTRLPATTRAGRLHIIWRQRDCRYALQGPQPCGPGLYANASANASANATLNS
jgi:hypothetical protein